MSLKRTFNAAEVWLAFIKDIFGVLSPAAARRCIESVDRFAVVSRDDSAGFVDGPGAHRGLDRDALIDLRPDGRQQIKPAIAKAIDVCDSVGAGGDGLSLLRFE